MRQTSVSRMGRTTGLVVFATAAVILGAAAPASAATIWANWTSATIGEEGTGAGSGTVNGVAFTYRGEVDLATVDNSVTFWAPDSSFIGGSVTASPSTVGDAITLNGSTGLTNTITFESPLVNPVFAIFSLGQPSVQASFTFDQTPTLQAGGPNSSFGGGAITVLGNVVSGFEGNGVVQFTGIINAISWTNTFENNFSFTIGAPDDLTPPTDPGAPPVPEPASLTLLAMGTAALTLIRRRTPQPRP